MEGHKEDFAAEGLWRKAKDIYISSLSTDEEKAQAENYFSMVTRVSLDGALLKIYASNKFAADFLQENYSARIKAATSLAGGDAATEVAFEQDPGVQAKIVSVRKEEKIPAAREGLNAAGKPEMFISTLPLDENYIFEEFVQGPSNSWAYAAAKGVAKNPGQQGYNPLFIHGGTGLGKTHLMQAIGNELKKKNPKLLVCYLTAETFLNEYVNALQKNTKQAGVVDAFRNRYRNVDVLLVDDIQFLQRGKGVQEEFFNTFNDLKANRKQIVMTSDVAPKNLPALEERLISRFEGGMVQEIEAPGYETRLAILKKKTENQEHQVPPQVLDFIAQNIRSHVRAMEGALAKVNVTLQMGHPPETMTDSFLSVLLKDLIEKEQSIRNITIGEIQECVTRKFRVTMEQLLSPDRTQSLVTPRQLAMYISRKCTTKSLQEIASAFDKKHATIIHGVKTMESRLKTENDLKQTFEEIMAELGYSIDQL